MGLPFGTSWLHDVHGHRHIRPNCRWVAWRRRRTAWCLRRQTKHGADPTLPVRSVDQGGRPSGHPGIEPPSADTVTHSRDGRQRVPPWPKHAQVLANTRALVRPGPRILFGLLASYVFRKKRTRLNSPLYARDTSMLRRSTARDTARSLRSLRARDFPQTQLVEMILQRDA